jgi:hypothetical protein
VLCQTDAGADDDAGTGFCQGAHCDDAADCYDGGTCYGEECVDICADEDDCADAGINTNHAGVECVAAGGTNTDKVCKPKACETNADCPAEYSVCTDDGVCATECTGAADVDDVCENYDMGIGVECVEYMEAPNPDMICVEDTCDETSDCTGDNLCYNDMCVMTCDDETECPDDCSETNECDDGYTCLAF